MKRLGLIVFIGLLLLPSTSPSAEKGLTVKSVRYFSYSAFTRIVIEIESAAPYVLTRSADGRSLQLTSYEGPCTIQSPLPPIRDGVVAAVEAKEEAGKQYIIVRLEAGAGEVKDFVLRGPDRIVLDVPKRAGAVMPPVSGEKQILITLDPGHGGRDSGIITAQGEEKALTLELAQAIRKILQQDQRLKVALTRDRDLALALDDRAAAANASGAALFVSLHVATGRETRVYIQDPNDADMQTERPDGRDFLGFESDSELQEKLWGRQQAAHEKESGTFGRILARELGGNPAAEPVQAPLAGLKAVDAAAVLVEIGAEQDRARAAEAVAKGIEQYVVGNR